MTGEVVRSVTPNPFGQDLRIAVSGAQSGQLRLSDANGKSVVTGAVTNREAVTPLGEV